MNVKDSTKYKIIKLASINILILMLVFIMYKLKIRICIIYHIFSIPCPGCGFTRSAFYLLKGDIKSSLEYNILTIPLAICYLTYIVLKIKDILKKENKVYELFIKYNKFFLIIVVILFIISGIKNINNSLLY